MKLYLTPAAIGYLAQLIITVLVGGYVLGKARQPNRPRHILLLAGFYIAVTAFIASLFLEAALLPTGRLYVVLVQNTLLALALLLLLQFAYHFPVTLPGEAKLSWVAGGLYALWEAGYALYRLARLGAGVIEYRSNWSDVLLLLFFLWVPAAFLRQVWAQSDRGGEFWMRCVVPLLRPPTRPARAARAFALIFLFVATLNLFTLLRAAYWVSVSLSNMGISLGISISLFVFALVYLNHLPEMTSFLARLAGVALITMLLVLSIVGWVISPIYEATYQPDLPDHRALRFAPNDLGGYDVTEIPLTWHIPRGERLSLAEDAARTCSAPLAFEFPFYGQTYAQVYICNDGTVSMGQPMQYRMYQYRYGAGAPLILPLLTDLYPEMGPGGVFVSQESGRLIATWAGVRGFVQQEAEFTFQATLYASGVFDLAYNGLPERLAFHANDDPGASVWAVGALPGSLSGPGPQVVERTTLPIRGGPEGIVWDYLVEFRRHVHAPLASLAVLILIASALVSAGFPLMLYVSLVRPLNALLRGVQQMETGQMERRVPVQFEDEIGSLTRSFNVLASTLSGLIYNLGERVAERTALLSAQTAELDAANAHLRAEMAAREEAQATIIAQQRDLAALEERTRLGRDLHDGLGQVLEYINVQTQAARVLFSQESDAAGDALLARLAAIAQQGHADVREFILGMRTGAASPARADQQTAGFDDFGASLKKYVQHCDQLYGQPVHLDIPQTWAVPWLSSSTELNLLRILREALTNALRHARAQRIDVRLEYLDNELLLTISDDGVGFTPAQPSPVSRKRERVGTISACRLCASGPHRPADGWRSSRPPAKGRAFTCISPSRRWRVPRR
ncbi:MAG: HAMP domain-containing protein [Anaerolineae bacterium]|nr:HAMP domain-containing protein [Anaerolineae bacterium]